MSDDTFDLDECPDCGGGKDRPCICHNEPPALNLDELERRARRDDWHTLIVGSDIRMLIALARRTESHEREMRKALALLDSVSFQQHAVANRRIAAAIAVLQAALAK